MGSKREMPESKEALKKLVEVLEAELDLCKENEEKLTIRLRDSDEDADHMRRRIQELEEDLKTQREITANVQSELAMYKS